MVKVGLNSGRKEFNHKKKVTECSSIWHSAQPTRGRCRAAAGIAEANPAA
jgi:hypothetical protein